MSLSIKSLVQVILFLAIQVAIHILAIPICFWILAVDVAKDYKEFLEEIMAWAKEGKSGEN